MFVVYFLLLLLGVGVFCAGGFLVGIAKNNILIYGLFLKRENKAVEKDKVIKDVKLGLLLMCIGLVLMAIVFYFAI